MKKIIPFIFLLLLTGCASMQPRQEPTVLMTPEQKILYYQNQINHYQLLINQEQKKVEAAAVK
jgi:hypothetical protein